jgi:hypothetical protein
MCYQLIDVPWPLTSHIIPWRARIEDSANIVNKRQEVMLQGDLLWKPQIDVLGPWCALIQIPIERSLLNHSCM